MSVSSADLQGFQGDVAIVSVAELPAFVESGCFLPVPAALKSRDRAFHWDSLLPNVAGLLASWNHATYGVPLLGEGNVLAYRKDRFAEAKLSVPATWEEFVDAAKKLAKAGPPSLPSLPKAPSTLETEFHLIAACYDQAAIAQSEIGQVTLGEEAADRLYSYQYRLKTSEPRINAPAFVHAFELMREMRAYRAAARDGRAEDVFREGIASLAIVSLAELARLEAPDSPVRGKIGVAPLPGAGFTYDRQTGEKLPIRANVVNRVPYLGWGNWVGLVSRDCANPDMAFAFLTGFADPEKMGAETIVAAKWGAGPLRAQHTEERSRNLWFGYNLPANDTENLLTALKENLAPSIVNHRYRLRLPNQQQHLEEFDRHIRAALLAEKADAHETLDRVNEAWKKLWTGIAPEKKRAWIAENYGL